MEIAIELAARTPIAIRAERASASSTTLPYLPATALLGALAAAHQQLRPGARDEFSNLFVNGGIRVGNAYPASFTRDELRDPFAPVLPLPGTARSCKRWPGFRYQHDADHERHGVYDSLFAWTIFALSGEEQTTSLQALARCPQCQETMDALSGFFRRGGDAAQYGRSTETTILLTRTGMNRATNTVQDGILYSMQALAEGSHFWAWVSIDDRLSHAFRAFVEEAEDEGLLRVGTARTRGLGRLHATPNELPDDQLDTQASIKERIDHFDQQLRAVAAKTRVATPHQRYVPILLTADLLLRDPMLRWRTTLDAEALAAAGIPDAELIYQAARVTRVMGWNTALGLPRPDALAVTMGSVFIFGFHRAPDMAALARLQHEGMGMSREAGFGRLRIADRFHWEVQPA